ncbi:MAG TPA: hypothetical protein VGJ53_07890 [Micromonosporaceae bacterium]|jgi:hypothetical protein
MMFNSPESLYTVAKDHQRELIEVAERHRVLRSARRSRRARRGAPSAESSAGRAGPRP